MSSYPQRLKQAREHAKLSQRQLAKRLGGKVSQQTIGYLEVKAARGSQYTAALAQACGVNAMWLATGRGEMLNLEAPPMRVEEELASYDPIGGQAADVARTWSELSPAAQEWTRNLIWMLRLSEKKYPWFWRGHPRSSTYDDWERQIEQNFEYKVDVAAKKQRSKT